MRKIVTVLLCLLPSVALMAEDGSQLWLRYAAGQHARVENETPASATTDLAVAELREHWSGGPVTLRHLSRADDDGFAINAHADGSVVIEGTTPLGLLYGAYELLRRQQMGTVALGGSQFSHPAFALRMLNHWDNLDGSIERGYAGKSLWKWEIIDERLLVADPALVADSLRPTDEQLALKDRLRQYCRANASIGINATVLNNVNASPKMLTPEYINKVKVLADLMRPYGLRVWLSINFATPKALGFTKTADPKNQKVREWWKAQADSIYELIPDFGGFLVKANSEGQPGPGDYGRTHADGANMLAEALSPHGGTVVWRSFVYGANHKGEDRVKQAVSEFASLDGQFASNVILQSKNGPLDFQPREPYAPIFDNISKTPQMTEWQITQEYTGQSNHLVYLATMWKEFLSFVSPDKLKGVAGVANIGDDANYCGHHFSQANWYAFGRLAWDPALTAEEIAEEWVTQTWNDHYYFVRRVVDMMMRSREACVDYMMPLGLHHIFKFDHHYGPEPGGFKQEYPLEWCPVYYHQATKDSIGFDRTSRGSGATLQYREPYRSQYDNVETCPEEYLLWFHRVPWSHRMKSGESLWEALVHRYDRGCDEVVTFCELWKQLRPWVDPQRWQEVDDRLRIQYGDACEWRDTCLQYFYDFSGGFWPFPLPV